MLYSLCLHNIIYDISVQVDYQIYVSKKLLFIGNEVKILSLKQEVQIALIKKNWSQRELARQMDISMAYLQDILKGNRKPIERLKQIEKILDIYLEVESDEPIRS